MTRWLRLGGARLRQWYADLLAAFWLRPAVMTLVAVVLAETLIWTEGGIDLPGALSEWVYAGGKDGARDVLGAIATASIGVAGTTFSITVAALTLASNQMGPRLLRNFTRDPGNQYALGTFLATFAYSLLVLRTVRGRDDESDFVPQLAISVALLLAFCCVAVLMWFLNHVASSINVTHVVALVHDDLTGAIKRLPERRRPGQQLDERTPEMRDAAPLHAPANGYLRVLDDAALADWAAQRDAVFRLVVRPGNFVFRGSRLGEIAPSSLQAEAEKMLNRAITLGRSRSVEQDIEFAVRQLVEVALRALSPSLNDPFTAIAVLDRFGAALCDLAERELPDGRTFREGRLRVERPATDYVGLLDAMLHMVRQDGASSPAVMIRLAEVVAEVAAIEQDPHRRHALRRHLELAFEAAMAATGDRAAREDLADRHQAALRLLTAVSP